MLSVPTGTLDITKGTLVEKHHIDVINEWASDEETVIERLRFDPPRAAELHAVGKMNVAFGFTTPPFSGEPTHSIHGKVLGQACDHVRMILDAFKQL